MLLPQRKITFTRKNGDIIEYDYVCEIDILRSYQVLTDTAKIVIPRKLVYDSGEPLTQANRSLLNTETISYPAPNNTVETDYVVGADAIFARGDKVKIELGYYPNLVKRFEGYISKVSTTLPIEIHCEDNMWLLKQFNVKYPTLSKSELKLKNKKKGTYKIVGDRNTHLKELLDDILGQAPADIGTIQYKTVDDNLNLGTFLINNVTPAKVLEVLKDKYGLYSYFKDDGILYVGWASDASQSNTQEFVMEEVVIEDDQLQYENEKDVKIKIHGVSMNADNTKFEYDAGDPSGDTITKFTYNQTEAGLKAYIDKLLPVYKYSGYRGWLKTFGEPAMNHGDIAKIVSRELPERDGNYLIKSVKIHDGTKGYFQELELGAKVA